MGQSSRWGFTELIFFKQKKAIQMNQEKGHNTMTHSTRSKGFNGLGWWERRWVG
jgi:hypothetical protein